MLLVCCGMIRSGSTLQYNLVRSLVETSGLGCGEGFVSDPSRDHRLRLWCWDKTWHAVKMHRVADWMLEEQVGSSIRFFYTHRNLRDVAASAKRKFGMPNASLWQSIDAAILLQQRLQGRGNVRIQRYADLMGSLSESLREIATFLDLQLSDQVLSDIVASCSLANAQRVQSAVCDLMSAQGIKAGDAKKAAIFDQTTLLHHNHISPNQGQDGTWHSDLTASDLQMIDRRYGKWLQTEGYIES